MHFLYMISIIPNALLIIIPFYFLSYGQCYRGCTSILDYWFVIFLLPFAVPLYVSIAAILRWLKGKKPRKLHAIIVGIYCSIIVLFGIGSSLLYLDDAALHLSLVPMGLAIGLPAIYAMVVKPELA